MTPDVSLGEHAVLRVAAWSIESVAVFRAPELAAATDAWIADELAHAEVAAALCDRLHAAVPRLERRARAAALRTKRRLFGGQGLPALDGATGAALRAIDPDLTSALDAARRARQALLERRAALERRHDEALARQSEILRARAREPALRRAVTLANQSLRQELDGATKPARRRRREATLLHYWMRAAGRPTPFGLFAGIAGVAPVGDGGLTITPAAPAVRVSVDIVPFEQVLEALAATPRYAASADLRASATLRACAGGWCFEQARDGARVRERLPHHPICAALLGPYLRGFVGPAELVIDALTRAVAGGAAMATELRRLAAQLVARGALRVDLDLLRLDTTPRAALAAVASRLLEPERARWRAALAQLDACADALERELLDLSPETLGSRAALVDAVVAGLWRDAGIEAPAPRGVLRVDLGAPVTASWGRAARAGLAAAIAAVQRFHAAEGTAELYRRATVEPWRRALGDVDEAPLLELEPVEGARAPAGADVPADQLSPGTLESIFARFAGAPGLAEALARQARRWRAWIRDPAARRLDLAPRVARPDGAGSPGRAGATLVQLSGDGAVWVGPSRPQPGLFAARFHGLLVARGEEAVTEELRRAFSERAPDSLELVGRDPSNPNAATRPALAPEVLDLREGGRLGALTLRLDASGRPRLRAGDGAPERVPVYNSAAALGRRDVWSWRAHTLAMAQGWEYCSFDAPVLAAERERWHHRPRLLMGDGVVLARERWVLDHPQLAAVAAAAGFDRYLAWRRLVGPLGVPPLVHAATGDDAPELLLVTDSPLALRCLFDTHAARARALILRELPGDPARWPVVDAAGEHHLAELAVHWWR